MPEVCNDSLSISRLISEDARADMSWIPDAALYGANSNPKAAKMMFSLADVCDHMEIGENEM